MMHPTWYIYPGAKQKHFKYQLELNFANAANSTKLNEAEARPDSFDAQHISHTNSILLHMGVTQATAATPTSSIIAEERFAYSPAFYILAHSHNINLKL